MLDGCSPASPPSRRAQTDTGARAVEMHLILCGEERLDVAVGEKIGRPMRAVQNAELPVPSQHRTLVWSQRIGFVVKLAADMQHIADSENTSRVAAKPAERECRARAEIERRIEPAAH